MRGLTLPTLVATALLAATPAFAQTPAPPSAAPAAPPAATPPIAAGDPLLARVNGDEIHASDLADAAASLPDELRGMPQSMLYPMLLDQLIDRRAIIMLARKQNLAAEPAVQKQIARATDAALQNALLTREITPALSDEAIKARYDRDYANKPGEEEADAAHILVADEDKARAIIKQLDAGADFSKLAAENSTDPSAKQNNGDLGFFKRTDMLPEFSDAAFALKPGEITQTPVKTRFGWHVIKLISRRTAPAPTLDQVRDDVRQSLIQEGVTRVLAQAKQGLDIQKFNPDGTVQTDAPPPPAVIPPPAPAQAPAR